MMDLQHRWNDVSQRIEAACVRAGRSVSDVHMVAVTKYLEAVQMQKWLQFGWTHVGENRVESLVDKWDTFSHQATWHFIGSLQRRKVKEVIGKIDYLHSLDRFSLAEEIDKRLDTIVSPLKCFIQVNISGEKSKHGISPQELEDFLGDVANFFSIQVIGLMTMAPLHASERDTRGVFRELRMLRDRLLTQGQLSMGMSQDFEWAIEEGATWIRLGSILMTEEQD